MAATSTSEPPVAVAPSVASPPGVRRLRRDNIVMGEQTTRPRWWGELLVVAWLAVLYDTVTNLAPARQALALAHGRSILSFERSFGIEAAMALNPGLSRQHTGGAITS